MTETKTIQSGNSLVSSTKKIGSTTAAKRWTDAELNFLRVNYKKMTGKEISEKLGRPLSAVYCKVKAENIVKARPYHYKKKKSVPVITKKETTETHKNNKSLNNYLILTFGVMSVSALIMATIAIIMQFIH
jgi:hypothetical protein